MKTATLIFAGLLAAVCAFGSPPCEPNTPQPASGKEFTPIKLGNKLAIANVNFCEDGDTIIEIFFLGKSNDDHHTYLYVEETILGSDEPIWMRCKEQLDGCNEFTSIPPGGGCGGVAASFFRPIITGSGLNEANKTGPACKPVTYTFCGHGKNLITYDYHQGF